MIPSTIKPMRPYQTQAVEDVRSSIRSRHRRIVLQLATGAGKTRIAAEIIRMAEAKGSPVLFMAPRRELIFQAQQAFYEQGIFAGVIMAGCQPTPSRLVQVASFDTLSVRGIRNKSMRMPPAKLLVVDECHLSIAKTRREIIEHYADAIVLGLTATPSRADGAGLGEVYDDLILGPSVRQLTDEGVLVPVRYFAPSAPDLSAVKLNADGDYVETQLGKVMDRPELIGDVVDNWLRLAPDRRTVIFNFNCAHSRHVRDAFLERGIAAEHVDGETPADERKDIFERAYRGVTRVLCNVFVASYGLDIPPLDCAVINRPTRNIALYLQEVGRVLRAWPDKIDAMVIDHTGAVADHGFVDDFIPWSLDSNVTIRDAKKAADIERAAPKELICPHCSTAFKGRRSCPSCGYEMVMPTEAIPVKKADLVEIEREKRKENRELTGPEKEAFYGELKQLSKMRGKKDGWASNMYRDRFGVWPNHYRDAAPRPPTPETLSYVQSRNIRYAKGRAKEQVQA